MLTLRELQAALRNALLGDAPELAAGEIAGDGLAPETRLAIYRHHVFTTLTAALKATFPVVCRLVDERFFGYAVDCYIRGQPPAAPCLFEYGATFPEFLAAFPPCRHLGYLPDVARLEWALNIAEHAADVEAMDPARLGEVPVAEMAHLTFTFEPSMSLLQSPWPVDQIWRANQDHGASGALTVDLAAGDVRLEIRRVDGIAIMRVLDAGTHALRNALAHGSTLEQAASAALATDPGFDLTQALHQLLEERTVVDFAVSN